MRILVIEDDPDLCNLLEEYFVPEGFQVEAVHNGRDGLKRGLSGDHDFVILDVRLPGLNGFEVLRQIRTESDIPILMLTSCDEDTDKIRGLELGADDYLNKPFNLLELNARIRTILRRFNKQTTEQKSSILVVGDIQLDSGSRRVYRNGEEISLTAAEFTLLELLLQKAGQVIPRDELVRHVQGRRFNPYDRSIDVHISRLRKKLSLHSDGSERIKAVRGIGHFYSLLSDSKNTSE